MLNPRLVLFASLFAGAGGLVFAASSAPAQDYRADTAYHDQGEIVRVIAPRQGRSSVTGAPIAYKALSQDVRYDDLDLTTDEGDHVLHERISDAAHALCRELNTTYKIEPQANPDCYRQAMGDAMAQAGEAIDRAYGNNED